MFAKNNDFTKLIIYFEVSYCKQARTTNHVKFWIQSNVLIEGFRPKRRKTNSRTNNQIITDKPIFFNHQQL